MNYDLIRYPTLTSFITPKMKRAYEAVKIQYPQLKHHAEYSPTPSVYHYYCLARIAEKVAPDKTLDFKITSASTWFSQGFEALGISISDNWKTRIKQVMQNLIFPQFLDTIDDGTHRLIVINSTKARARVIKAILEEEAYRYNLVPDPESPSTFSVFVGSNATIILNQHNQELDIVFKCVFPYLTPAYEFESEEWLVNAISERTEVAYEKDEMDRLTTLFDFGTKELDKQIKQTRENMESAYANAAMYAVELQRILKEREQLKLGVANSDKVQQVINFLEGNKHIVRTWSVDRLTHKLYISFITPLRYYDVVKIHNTENRDLIRLLGDPQDHQLLTTTYIELDFKRATISRTGTTDRTIYLDEKDYLNHPHIGRYNCWGSSAREITDMILAGNIEGALYQIIGVLSCVDLADTAGAQMLDRGSDFFRDLMFIRNGVELTGAQLNGQLIKEELECNN